MNDPTVTGVGGFILLVVAYIGNYWMSRRAKKQGAKQGADEAKNYTDEVVKLLQDDISSLQIRIAELVNENYLKDRAVVTAQAERDAARAENKALAKQLEEEHESLIQTANRADELEKRVQALEQQNAKNDAVKDAAQEIVKLIRDGFTQLVSEMAAPKLPVVPVGAAAEGANPT